MFCCHSPLLLSCFLPCCPAVIPVLLFCPSLRPIVFESPRTSATRRTRPSMAFLCLLVFYSSYTLPVHFVVCFLHAHTFLLATATHHIPAVADPVKCHHKCKRLLDQHHVARAGICLLLCSSLWLACSSPFLCIYLSCVLCIMGTCLFLLMDHHPSLGRSNTDRITFECGHLDEEYIDALKGIVCPFLLCVISLCLVCSGP